VSEELNWNNAKYVIYRGLEVGNRFFSLNNKKEPEEEKVKLLDGTVAYKILGYANTVAEAQIKLYGRSFTDCTD